MNKIILVSILLGIIVIAIIFLGTGCWKPFYSIHEGYTNIDTTQTVAADYILPTGFYRIDETHIAALPKNDEATVYPKTQTYIDQLPPGYIPLTSQDGVTRLVRKGSGVNKDTTTYPIPTDKYTLNDKTTPVLFNQNNGGDDKNAPIIPDGMYRINDASMAPIPTGYKAGYAPTAEYPIPQGCFDFSLNAISVIGALPSGFYRVSKTTMAKFPAGNNVSVYPENDKYVPFGYYAKKIDDKNWLAPIPSGYGLTKANDPLSGITPKTQAAMYAEESKKKDGSGTDTSIDMSNNNYNTDNLDLLYHDTIEDIKKQTDDLGQGVGSTTVMKDGKLVTIPYVANFTLPTYYQPGSFVYGGATYVPNYQDSVYLSKTSGMYTYKDIYPTTSQLGGFCDFYKNDKTALEQKCNKLDLNACASTSCCVLLGGSKCVSGGDSGPSMKANYTDPFIDDKDYYYYQGKCYGNCPNK